MNCERAAKIISARLDRDLSPGEAAQLDEHLAACRDCRRAADDFRNLTADLESAFRSAPVRLKQPIPTAARPARRAIGLRLAAAAALLLGAGLLLGHTLLTRAGSRRKHGVEWTELASGTRVFRHRAARVLFGGAMNDVDELIQLDRGEVEVAAVRAEPGRCSVRVVTPAGEVVTLGTRFSVEVKNPGRTRVEGEGEEMNRLIAAAAAVMVVSVTEGEVLVSGSPGQTVVRAGEQAEIGGGKLTVGKTDRILKGRVIKVDGAAVTISVGRSSGVREGFEFNCKAKGWSGKVLVVRKNSAVLAVKGDAAVGDVAATGFTTILTEAPGRNERTPARPAAVEGGEVVGDLRLTLFEGTRVSRTVAREYVPGGDAEGQEKVTETVARTLHARIENVGRQPVILPLVAQPFRKNVYSRHAVELHARDTEGQAVDRVKRPARQARRDAAPAPPAVTVLKPGESIRQPVEGNLYRLRFPAAGKFKVWVEFAVPAAKDQPLEGHRAWSGKLKSNEVDWEHRPGRAPSRGPSRNRRRHWSGREENRE